MEPTRKYGAFSSSVDPQKLSETVIGVAKVVSGLLVFAGVFTVADSTTLLNNVNQIVAAVLAAVPLGYAAWNSAQVVFGLIQKGIVAITKKY